MNRLSRLVQDRDEALTLEKELEEAKKAKARYTERLLKDVAGWMDKLNLEQIDFTKNYSVYLLTHKGRPHPMIFDHKHVRVYEEEEIRLFEWLLEDEIAHDPQNYDLF